MSQPVRITRFTVIILPTLTRRGTGSRGAMRFPFFRFGWGAVHALVNPNSCQLPGIQISLMSRRRREHRTLREA